jgi:hypothetical protein
MAANNISTLATKRARQDAKHGTCLPVSACQVFVGMVSCLSYTYLYKYTIGE